MFLTLFVYIYNSDCGWFHVNFTDFNELYPYLIEYCNIVLLKVCLFNFLFVKINYLSSLKTIFKLTYMNFYTKGFHFKTMHVYCNSVIQLIKILYEGAETLKKNYFEIGGGEGITPFLYAHLDQNSWNDNLTLRYMKTHNKFSKYYYYGDTKLLIVSAALWHILRFRYIF